MILELCDNTLDIGSKADVNDVSKYDKNLNPFECGDNTSSTSKHRFSLSDVKKFPNVKKLIKPKREKSCNGLCLKITTSKMRCSIKVKEEFENDAGMEFLNIFVGREHFFSRFNFSQHKFISRRQYLSMKFFLRRGEVNCSYRHCLRDGIILILLLSFP